MRPSHPIRVWSKVAVLLVLLDVVLFRTGLVWRARPDFGNSPGAMLLSQVFDVARQLETVPARPTNALVVGSSVVLMGINPGQASLQLGRHGVPVGLVTLGVFGASTTDAALLAWQGRRLTPWLVAYAASARDFCKQNPSDSPVARAFYDGSVELPLLPREGLEARLDAQVRRYWQLYRYGFLVRAAADRAGHRLLSGIGVPDALAATPPATLPPEAVRRVGFVTPEAFAAWTHWYETRRFEDYARWIILGHGQRILDAYHMQTLATCGPEDNPHVRALEWLEAMLAGNHTRTLLVYFPENPVFAAPEARPYFDPALSDAQADLLAREAAAHGARFVDLRHLLDAEDFTDLVHPNAEGNRKLTEAVASIVEDEWRARGG